MTLHIRNPSTPLGSFHKNFTEIKIPAQEIMLTLPVVIIDIAYQ